MKKLLLALFALTLLVAFTAPSYAAEFKFGGFYRVRGTSQNVNIDGDDDADDKKNYLDALARPRFTAKGKSWTIIWEPEFQGPNNGFKDAGRQTVGVNRWVADHAIPGSALRMRWGRTDYTSPDGEIYDTNGSHRKPGIAVYGKLSKNVSLSVFHTKAGEDATPTNADKSDYYGALSIKASPTLTLTPWAANSRDGADNSFNYSYLGLNAKGKAGVLGVNVSGVFQSGEMNDSTDLSAWAILVRTTAGFGRLKFTGHLTMLSGDDNATDGEDNQFHFPLNNKSGALFGGLFMSSRSWTGHGGAWGGNRLTHLNGAVVLGVSADYKVSKTLTLRGAVYSHNAAEAKGGAGVDDAKDFGTELNAGMLWKITSNLSLRMDAGVMMRGDYGKAGDKDIDDGWMAAWRLNHSF